ncbi:MAG: hypothetical protein IT204_11485 [Fimbriimonadaceae bacterium]|nr:hypothetical protein [Fimbriimonadaceae bacterium]
MDPVTIAAAVGLLLVGEWLVGHVVLFLLLHRAAGLAAGVAVRLGHLLGLLLGYASAATLPLTAGAVVCWSGQLLPGAVLAAGAAIWALLLAVLPPGFASDTV